MSAAKPLLVGVVLGVAAGVGGTLYWKSLAEAPPLQTPPPVIDTRPLNPHGGAMPSDSAHGGGSQERAFAKVHFMREFVAALTELPKNLMPAVDYEPLLKEGAAEIRCADCHTDKSLNMEGMIANDPGDEAVQPFRMQRHGFMIPLMEKWVARLNKLHADRLRKEVTCTDCHAIDPHEDEALNATIPPLMIRFVKALREPPENPNPAEGWKPLLKDPSTTSMFCGVCHGQVGLSMEKNIDALDGPEPPEVDENPQFMINLMERWVRELNKRMKDQLVKAVSCTDCHETDPRK